MSARSKPAAKPTTVDAYLKAVNPDQRKALQKLRQDIHFVAPGAEECISYGMPAFAGKENSWLHSVPRKCIAPFIPVPSSESLRMS